MKRVLIFSALLVIMNSAFQHNAIAQNGQKQPVKIVMFGNSITHGGDWPTLLARKDVVNWGIPGYLTGQLLWTIKDVLAQHPGTGIWFIEGGINDIYLGMPVKRIYQNFQVMVDSLRNNDIIPVVQSTIFKRDAPEDNKKVAKLNRKVKAWCNKNQVLYIDLNEFLSADGELKEEFSIDGCHLKPPAYIPWAQSVKEMLKRNGF